jgi:hypothetical protein
MYLIVQGTIDDVFTKAELTQDDLAEVQGGNIAAFEFRPLNGKFYEAQVDVLEAEKDEEVEEDDDLDLDWEEVATR